MESYCFLLDEYQAAHLSKPIRRKFDIIDLWMRAIKAIINYYPPEQQQIAASLEMRFSKMSRLFYSSNDRTFSVNFPFKITHEDESYIVRMSSGVIIDSRLSSELLFIADALREKNLTSEWDLIQFFEDHGEISENFWPVFSDLIDAEDGYLRFDHDPLREDGHKHPLNHADLFYSNGATFKLGLDKRLSLMEIIDFLDLRTDCHYLSKKTTSAPKTIT